MSATVPGSFDCSKLLEIKAKVEQIWHGEGVINKEYAVDVEPARAILQNQTATLEELELPDKDREIKVYWVDDCDDADPVACTDQCTIDGDEIGDNCQDYELTECFEKSFKVTEERFRRSLLSKEEVVARAMLKKLKLMDEFWAAKAIAFFEVAAGVNSFPGQYTVVGTNTYIPATAWNPDIFGYIDTALWMNKLGLSRILSGTLLKQYMWKIVKEVSNPTGEAEASKMNSMGVPYFDRRLDTILGEKALFLFDGNSVAMGTKARHSIYGDEGRKIDTPDGMQHWMTIKSNSLPGVVYDLAYQEICSGNDISHLWKIKTRGDIWLNPLGCDNNRTGVLKFVCGEAP